MSNQYLVITPKSPRYSGKACGVRFENGRAFVSEYTIDPRLGWTVEDVIQKMKADFGYDVQEVAAPPAPFPQPAQPFEVLPSVNYDDIHADADPAKLAEVNAIVEKNLQLPKRGANQQKRNKAGASVAPEVTGDAVSK